MATTTNYSWTTPDNTAYVKDGAAAIRSLGSSVDTTLFNTTGGKNVGLQYITGTSFTTASTFAINSCFTSAYENYVIQLDIRSMTAAAVFLGWNAGGVRQTFGAYGWANVTAVTTVGAAALASQGQIQLAGATGQTALRGTLNVFGPQIATSTVLNMQSTSQNGQLINLAAGGYSFTDSFDGFTILGTAMSGNCKVYGVRN